MISEFGLEEAEQFISSQGKDFFTSGQVEEFCGYYLPKDSDEAKQCLAILDILTDYSQRENAERPLSIAVFGPPGSGKSTAVKKLAKKAGAFSEQYEINLSQLSDPRELGQALLSIFSLAKKDAARMVFFDEFDSALGSTPLGWLKFFLAPMQDGFFYYDGKPIAVGKAVLIFAGGTADRYEDFEHRHAKDFVSMKGPDFVSRLRGFLNVEGLNKYGPERILRRALALHYQLGERSDCLNGDKDTRHVDPGLLDRLLAGAHYIHGARSLEALLDMCKLTKLKLNESFCDDHLPPKPLMELHVSRGPLEGKNIGVSAGQDDSSNAFFEQFTKELFVRGANLVHGGELLDKSPLRAMVKELQQLPQELVKRTEKRIRNLLPHPSFLRDEVKESIAKFGGDVDFLEMETISSAEFKRFGLASNEWFEARSNPYDVKKHLAWALSLFRMRLRLAQEIDALVVIGGKASEGWGRFPGVVEEVMLALALGRPVYILGMAGTTAKSIGHTMGLSAIQQTDPEFIQEPRDSNHDDFQIVLKQWSPSFDVPGKPHLPKTFDELRRFLADRAIGTDKWPENGLTVDENKKLFDAKNDPDGRKSCVELIVQGISRLIRKSGVSARTSSA